MTDCVCRGVQDLLVSPVIYLQGAYDSDTRLMCDELRNAALPLNEPFTALGYTHLGGGGENTEPSIFDRSGEDAIIDWELRNVKPDKENFEKLRRFLRK